MSVVLFRLSLHGPKERRLSSGDPPERPADDPEGREVRVWI